MSWLVAGFLGLVQGISELFPFSSLGILVILPRVAHLPVTTSGARYLPFLVALHAGTALALVIFFWTEWKRLIVAWFRSLRGEMTKESRLAWAVVIGTIPAGLMAALLQKHLTALFGKPHPAAIFLIVNGFLMLASDVFMRRQRTRKPLQKLNLFQALGIGAMQILALIPGISRSGSTITAGIFDGLSFEDAAHFSFLLATPIILAATLDEVPKLHGGASGLAVPALIGGLVAAVAAWFSVRFLMRYFEYGRLTPFAFISMGLGIVSLILLH